MQKVVLKFRGRPLLAFSSLCQFGIYLLDVTIRLSILFLFAFAGLAKDLIDSPNTNLGGYILIYIVAIIIWGLLLVKFVVGKRKVFGKTKFDLYFMGILTLTLISTLLSEDRVKAVFGSSNTWSYSVITLLSMAILYYVSVLVFRYGRGVKWLSLAFIASILVPGIYFTLLILKREKVEELSYLHYAVFSIPLTIGIIFIFRKIYFKVIAFAGLLFNLFLVAYYSSLLRGGMFMLGVGVLALFILFYISFWIKNSEEVIGFLREILSKVRNIVHLRKILRERRRESIIFLMMMFMALWVIGLFIFNWKYVESNIAPHFFDWVRTDLGKVEGLKMWLVGKPNLSNTFSSMEFINILASYGIFTLLAFVTLLTYSIFIIGKLTLKLLYTGSFRNVILLSSMFVTAVTIFVNFVLSRFTPLVYLLWIFVWGVFAIIEDLTRKKEVYALEECKDKLTLRGKIIQGIIVLLIVLVTFAGVLGVLLGVEKGIFS